MPLPEQLLLSDLLARRVRCDRGQDHGPGQLVWMHPPVHRLLGWASRPSALASQRRVWRLDQLRGLAEGEVFVQGDPAECDAGTLERLPTLMGASLLAGGGEPLGRLADLAFELRSGRILHYLVARSDPRLPGSSRWRLSPDRIVDQRPGEVSTALQGLNDLPLARASLRETLLRRSRRWRDQWDEEASRWRDQWQQTSGRLEDRLEGWLEEPPWQDPLQERQRGDDGAGADAEIWPEEPWPDQAWSERQESRSGGARPPAPSGRRRPWLEDVPAPVADRRRWPADEPGEDVLEEWGGEGEEPWDGSPPGDAARRRPREPFPSRPRTGEAEGEEDPWV